MSPDPQSHPRPSVMDSQGALDERLERCAIELWAVDNRVRGEGASSWDHDLGSGDRRDYRWMAAAVLREAGVPVASDEVIAAAAQIREPEEATDGIAF